MALCLVFAWMSPPQLRGQSAPVLSISNPFPSFAEISWPTNFSGWQLVTATNLAPPAAWQPVEMPATPINGLMMVYYFVPQGQDAFFRLQKAGNCPFQASPAVIPLGGSSVLSWCQVAGSSYCLSPGPCPVTNSTLVVSPTVTTVYSLIVSNALGLTTNFATVTVRTGDCAFANLTGWDCTLNFSYEWTPSTDNYSFTIRQEGHLTFHLTPTTVIPNFTEYSGYASGNAQINDELDDHTIPPPNTTTIVGSGPPEKDPSDARTSLVVLDIDCSTDTFSFTLGPAITAIEKGVSSTVTNLLTVGRVSISHHALPATVGPLSGSGFVSARGPTWTGGGDLYLPGGLGPEMFFFGVVNDDTAGSASVNWYFTPTP